jgi:hypothetical protein
VVTFGSSELYSLDKEGKKGGKPGGSFDFAIPGHKAPADIGYDTKRGRLLVPLFQDNAVEGYDLQ